MLWFRRRLERAADEGFTLVEAIVSLVIIAIVLSSFTVAIVGSVRAGMVARENQQAGDALNRTVEQVRSLGYSSIAMDPADVTGTDGGLLSTCGTGTCLTVNGVQERLVLASGGAINPHISTLTLNNVPYTVKEYITLPTDSEAGATYKRLVVYVSWTAQGKAHTRTTTTIITDTRRGLPLPMFKFVPVGATTATVNPGAQVVYGFKVTNNGARDTWNLSTSAGSPTWTYVFDNGDNVYDPATDTTAVTDTTGDGIIDTGAIDPTQSVVIWAIRTVPASPAGPYTSAVSFTATSFAESAYTSTIATTTTVQTGVITPTASPTPTPTVSPTASPTPSPSATCPAQASVPSASANAGTLTAMYLFNENPNVVTTPRSTTAQSLMYLDKNNTPTGTTLYDYSTDDPTTSSQIQAGRILEPSTLGASETNALKVAHFQYTMTKNQTFNGTATIALWAVPQSGLSTDGVSLSFALTSTSKSGSSTVTTSRGSTSYSLSSWGCGTFNKLTVSLPMSNFTVSNNYTLDLYVTNTGSSNVRIGYGAASYAAQMVVPLS